LRGSASSASSSTWPASTCLCTDSSDLPSTSRRPYDLAHVVVLTMPGQTVSHNLMRNEGASSSRANRSVVVQDHRDCYLHGCPCGYFGDPRHACINAARVTVAHRSGSQLGTNSRDAWIIQSFKAESAAASVSHDARHVGLTSNRSARPAQRSASRPPSSEIRGRTVHASSSALLCLRSAPGWIKSKRATCDRTFHCRCRRLDLGSAGVPNQV
jgi:hypothetical protein